MIDLRSDTITKPGLDMRHAMMNADVGDDVFGDDPTVNLLQEITAEILGKEDSLYLPTGTMSNQIAFRCLTSPGDEVILHEYAHTYYYETGGGFVLSGVIPRLLKGERGMFSARDVENALRPSDNHFPPTTLICVENTTNKGGGAVWDIEEIRKIREVADRYNMRMHLDGARIWNATAASGIPEKEYAKYFDTVNVCFSKGLGAPVGSALCATKEIITKAKRFKKLFGGAMRQAGIIAAGALFALDNNRERLKSDHENAKKLAAGIAEIPGLEINPEQIETNIVIFRTTKTTAKELIGKLNDERIWMLDIDKNAIRAVTSLMVREDDITKTISVLKKLCC